MWERYGAIRIIASGLVALAAVGSALSEIANWPLWAVLVGVAVAVTSFAAYQMVRPAHVLVCGIGATAIVGLGILGWKALSDRSSPTATPREPATEPHSVEQRPWRVKRLAGYAPREIATQDDDVWVVANESTLLRLDQNSLATLGTPRHFGRRLEHVIACEGRVLVTFDRGLIARVSSRGRSRSNRVRYGDPLPAGSRNGMMACGGGSVFVALPLEAQIVRLALPELDTVATIPVGRSVDGLAFNDGRLYVLDAKQAATIVVDLTDNVPSRWIVTMPKPDELIGLGDGSLLISHRGARCLGSVAADAQVESAACRSGLRGGVRTLATGTTQAAILDRSGQLHRLEAQTGRSNSLPLEVPHGVGASDLAITGEGQMLLAVPSSQRLIAVGPRAWAERVTLAGKIECRLDGNGSR